MSRNQRKIATFFILGIFSFVVCFQTRAVETNQPLGKHPSQESVFSITVDLPPATIAGGFTAVVWGDKMITSGHFGARRQSHFTIRSYDFFDASGKFLAPGLITGWKRIRGHDVSVFKLSKRFNTKLLLATARPNLSDGRYVFWGFGSGELALQERKLIGFAANHLSYEELPDLRANRDDLYADDNHRTFIVNTDASNRTILGDSGGPLFRIENDLITLVGIANRGTDNQSHFEPVHDFVDQIVSNDDFIPVEIIGDPESDEGVIYIENTGPLLGPCDRPELNP